MDARSHHSNVGQLLWCGVGVARASDTSGSSLEVEGKNIEWLNLHYTLHWFKSWLKLLFYI